MTGLELCIQELDNNGIAYKKDVCGADVTTIKAGGKIALGIYPSDIDELITAARVAKKCGLKVLSIGRGSNTLFSDDGFCGTVIFTCKLNMTEHTEHIGNEGQLLRAYAGVPLTGLASYAANDSLSGLEFAFGIPGSVGGAVYMNAGAYGGQISDVCIRSAYYDVDNDKTVVLEGAEQAFGYRKSAYSAQRVINDESQKIILYADFLLTHGDGETIRSIMMSNMASRREKQPLEYPNAGSTFKRYPGYYMGKIIEDLGLKGYTVGGARISEKHAGFIINNGNATARDIKELIDYVSDRIHSAYGFIPECEIRIIDGDKKRKVDAK